MLTFRCCWRWLRFIMLLLLVECIVFELRSIHTSKAQDSIRIHTLYTAQPIDASQSYLTLFFSSNRLDTLSFTFLIYTRSIQHINGLKIYNFTNEIWFVCGWKLFCRRALNGRRKWSEAYITILCLSTNFKAQFSRMPSDVSTDKKKFAVFHLKGMNVWINATEFWCASEYKLYSALYANFRAKLLSIFSEKFNRTIITKTSLLRNALDTTKFEQIHFMSKALIQKIVICYLVETFTFGLVQSPAYNRIAAVCSKNLPYCMTETGFSYIYRRGMARYQAWRYSHRRVMRSAHARRDLFTTAI